MFPDGGISRLRVFGVVVPNWSKFREGEVIDLALVNNGGRSVGCSNQFYSSPSNLLTPGRGVNMGDGWETKRTRLPNHKDWAIIKLAAPSHLLVKPLFFFNFITRFFFPSYRDEKRKRDLLKTESKLTRILILLFSNVSFCFFQSFESVFGFELFPLLFPVCFVSPKILKREIPPSGKMVSLT